MPLAVRGTICTELKRSGSSEPVPLEFGAELKFEQGVSAGFYVSFNTHMQQWARISGEAGHLTVPDFVLPVYGNRLAFRVDKAEFNTYGCDFNMENYSGWHTTREYSNSGVSAQETNLFRRFSELVITNKIDTSWPEISLQTQQVLDLCYRSACTGSHDITLSGA
jgi:hypothetical protein